MDFVPLSCKSQKFSFISKLSGSARLECLKPQDSYQKNGFSIYFVAWTHRGHERPVTVRDLHSVVKNLDSEVRLRGMKSQFSYFLTRCIWMSCLIYLLKEYGTHTSDKICPGDSNVYWEKLLMQKNNSHSQPSSLCYRLWSGMSGSKVCSSRFAFLPSHLPYSPMLKKILPSFFSLQTSKSLKFLKTWFAIF